ncbi:MAG: hypothetical protein ACE15B_01880 [Bryobacteraceae bacterium]
MYSRGSDEEQLDALFRAYRGACPDVEPGPGFMPGIWERIEARQTFPMFFGRLARGFVTAAVALTIAMATYLYVPQQNGAFYSETYVEALASHDVETDLYEPVLYDPSEPAGQL